MQIPQQTVLYSANPRTAKNTRESKYSCLRVFYKHNPKNTTNNIVIKQIFVPPRLFHKFSFLFIIYIDSVVVDKRKFSLYLYEPITPPYHHNVCIALIGKTTQTDVSEDKSKMLLFLLLLPAFR